MKTFLSPTGPTQEDTLSHLEDLTKSFDFYIITDSTVPVLTAAQKQLLILLYGFKKTCHEFISQLHWKLF